MIDPHTHQTHIGYAHTLAANTTLSVDYTLSLGRNELRGMNINPIINGQRLLVPQLVAAGYPANQFGPVMILSPINKSKYDALTFLFQRRFPRATLQAHYTLAHAYSYRRLDGQPLGRRRAAGSTTSPTAPASGDRTGRTSGTAWWRPACSSSPTAFSSRPWCSSRARVRTT